MKEKTFGAGNKPINYIKHLIRCVTLGPGVQPMRLQTQLITVILSLVGAAAGSNAQTQQPASPSAVTLASTQSSTITNARVIEMTKLGLDDDVIIARIKHSGCNFQLSDSDLLQLKNAGVSTAFWVRIFPLKLSKRTLYFPCVSDSIEPTDYRRFRADVGSQWGSDSQHDLIRAMSEEWSSLENSATHREVLVPLRIDYENAEGVKYEVSLELLYHGGKMWNQPADFKCIECRNFQYRRIVTGGFESYRGSK